MARPRFQCGVTAFAAGLLLSAIVAGELKLVDNFYLTGLLAWWASMVLLFGTPGTLAFLVAKYSGPHDKAAFITTAVPAIVIFLYIFVLHAKGMLDCPAPVRNFLGLILTALLLLVWAHVTASCAIKLKRFLERKIVAAAQDQKES
ncbi:hypothetical protein BH09VER1_BH09VER1_05310 [soil metagenome]